ncbi:PREDICTED: uncharacterized protein LOC109587826 [Amphimedon queenslandica]|uniref:Tyr recombinase domain-containing protein n=1 Tax=Amphimedon queenslandica TaxID=400682 RepID=A0A1X7THZ9_AMPQE|nr:PREDICTED: uncharacterized protein LOC109587826 [Amphimedon queenslandica]|eukprot:XP_019859607.1 PREDICTED: uncharacterized protein LOC109587826 [Amphimedon queenslandica]
MFNKRPPLPKYRSTWDVNVVISLFQNNRGHSDTLSLKQLSYKLAMLLALSSAAHSSDIFLLDLRFRSFSQEGVTFQLASPSKTRRSGPPRSIFIKRLITEPILCPVSTLESYMYERATLSFRPQGSGMANPLFLSFNRHHKPVASSTISRWITATMKEAGIDTDAFQAHSTRAAASSRARSTGVPVEDILKCAGWSRRSTFERFYYKPISEPHLDIVPSGSQDS